MKPRPLLPCLAVLTTGILTGCGSTAGYKGPSLKFGIGYEGVELSVTLISKAPLPPTLTEAGTAFNALLPGGSGKNPTPTP